MMSCKDFYNEHPTKRCKYCLKDLDLKDATIDHVIPTARGGTDYYTNLVLACVKCNTLKGCLSVKGFFIKCDREYRKTKNKYYKTICSSIKTFITTSQYKELIIKKKKKKKVNVTKSSYTKLLRLQSKLVRLIQSKLNEDKKRKQAELIS